MAFSEFSRLNQSLPSKPPLLLIFIALLFLGTAAALSPQLMIKLGPMRDSLLSDLGAVRQIAEFELLAIRALLGLAGILCLSVWLFWGGWIRSRLVGYLVSHQPKDLPSGALFNAGFFWVGGGTLLTLLWIWLSGLFPALMPAIITKEDGIIEYVTAVLFLAAAGWAAWLAFRMPDTIPRTVYGFLAFGFLFTFAEEISWGQRIFGFATPDSVQKINVQGEFNFHNSLGYAADHVFISGVLVFGAIIPFLAHRFRILHQVFDLTGIPIASLGLALGFALASGLHGWSIYAVIPKTLLRVAEIRELLSALGFLILMLEIKRSLSGRRAA